MSTLKHNPQRRTFTIIDFLITFRITPARLVMFLLAMLLLSTQANARDVSFSWTANPDPLAGYKLYYKTGEDSGPPYQGIGLNQGDAPIILGKVTTIPVSGLSPDETYHFVLTAYNDDGESSYSTIVTVTPEWTPIISGIFSTIQTTN